MVYYTQEKYRIGGRKMSGDATILEVDEQLDEIIHLDYTLKTSEERARLVEEIVAKADPKRLTKYYLQKLSDYIIDGMSKEERREGKILTDNRMVTINKRETSYQGLASKFENGEDGVYHLFISDKNALLSPKDEITQEDIDTIPELAQLRENILETEEAAKRATGKQKYLLKKQLIQMRQDQYVIKNSYHPAMFAQNLIHSIASLDLRENIWMNADQEPESDGLITLLKPDHVSALLCNYCALKAATEGKFNSDLYFLLQALDELIDRVLKTDYPLYYTLAMDKAIGMQNVEIQAHLKELYGIEHSIEYISSLWRNKIPKLLARQYQEDCIMWYYTEVERGKWKKCSRCGEIKLAHSRFFSKNNTSKDGYYSICKKCRNAKTKKGVRIVKND